MSLHRDEQREHETFHNPLPDGLSELLAAIMVTETAFLVL